MIVHFLLVFNLLFVLIRIALWSSAGKELFPWPFMRDVFIFNIVLSPIWHLGQGVEFDCISSDHCHFINFV